jgi:hypothetical protein
MLRHAALDVALTAGLAILLLGPTAFLASAARGYLAPLGFAILTIFLAQITAATGWGAWFPWSVPALFSGLAGAASGSAGYTKLRSRRSHLGGGRGRDVHMVASGRPHHVTAPTRFGLMRGPLDRCPHPRKTDL